MKIFEVIEDEKINYIKDLLVFLKMKNQKRVSTNSVLAELQKMGVQTSFTDLSPLIDSLDFIEDINKEYITFKDSTDNDESISSDEKIDLDRDTVKSMADRARRRRERDNE